jgi:polyisoprenoid-binding protein YceI
MGSTSDRCAIAAILALAALPVAAPAPPLAAQPADPALYRLDPPSSLLWVVTHRRGLLSFLGHDHAITAGDWHGAVCWSAGDPGAATGSVRVGTASLRIDSDSARALAGLGRGPSPDQLRSIQEKFLGPEFLDAEAHPELTLVLDRVVAADTASLDVEGSVTIRGITRPVRFIVAVGPADANALRLAGGFQVRQTDHGMRPESVAGVVRVADAVDIRFDVLARPTGSPCP